MNANKSVAQRLGRVLEKVTRQSGRLSETPEYGSWLLGKVSESQQRRRVRIQVILTVFILVANLLGIGVALLLVTVAFPVPSVFTDAPAWITFGVAPAYIVLALVFGTFWITRGSVNALRWAIEERTPDARPTSATRSSRRGGWRRCCCSCGASAPSLLTTLYGLQDTDFIPRFLFAVGFHRHRRRHRAATCSPSSRCAPSPPRRWRRAARRGGSPPASWAAR